MTEQYSAGTREFDLVVFGASGFTGRLVVEYLAERYGVASSLRWALAGRNRDRLNAVVAASFGGRPAPAVLIADSDDAAALRDLARRARVILSTVGPYARYGSGLVAACASAGTHYCDLAGEPQWIRDMIDRHHDTALSNGAWIVPSCGFDSIPSDLGVAFLQRASIEQFSVPCREVSLHVRALRGGASGGTIASMTNVMQDARQDPEIAGILADPYGLNPAGERDGPDGADQRSVRFDEMASTWTAPFVMAAINTRIVRRSHALLGYPWGREFRYSEATSTGPGLRGWLRAMAMTGGIAAFMLGCRFKASRKLLIGRVLPAPGDGPSREQRENGFFDCRLYGRTASGDLIRARVTGDRDPGYGSTSRMLAESAVCLAAASMAAGGGFSTPAAAMGRALQDRLVANAGLRFELVE